jgi:hypothetical protein
LRSPSVGISGRMSPLSFGTAPFAADALTA